MNTRKKYVKPVIESEEFVANEYVAACWTVKCSANKCSTHPTFKNGKSTTIKGETLAEAVSANSNLIHPATSDHYDENTFGSESSGSYYHYNGNFPQLDTTPCHKVIIGAQSNLS